MTEAELLRKARIAMGMAFKDDERGHSLLWAFVNEMAGDGDVERLYDAADHLADVAMDVMASRKA